MSAGGITETGCTGLEEGSQKDDWDEGIDTKNLLPTALERASCSVLLVRRHTVLTDVSRALQQGWRQIRCLCPTWCAHTGTFLLLPALAAVSPGQCKPSFLGIFPLPPSLPLFFFPFSVSYVFAFCFSVKKLWDGISTYLGLSHSVHPTAASRPGLRMLSRLLFSVLATLVIFVGALSFLSKCQSNQFMSPLRAGLPTSLLSACATRRCVSPVAQLLSYGNQNCLVRPKPYTLC